MTTLYPVSGSIYYVADRKPFAQISIYLRIVSRAIHRPAELPICSTALSIASCCVGLGSLTVPIRAPSMENSAPHRHNFLPTRHCVCFCAQYGHSKSTYVQVSISVIVWILLLAQSANISIPRLCSVDRHKLSFCSILVYHTLSTNNAQQ